MNNQGSFPPRTRLSAESIPSTGLSVVYEPATDDPLVDIVMVHGLKGHPYKTWRFSQAFRDEKTHQKHEHRVGTSKSISAKLFGTRQRFKSWVKRSSSKTEQDSDLVTTASIRSPILTYNKQETFWPADFLPEACKKARILTFGYDTKVTKYTSGPTNMNSVLSHGKDFLFSLGRERVPGRPLIFIAHSLGGILVKEMLALSSTSDTTSLRGIVKNTAAIIFLGTPHRGSPELSAIGARARAILSGLRLQTTATILDTLRLENTDLQRAHEAFTMLWNQYDFRVKTFQEGFGLFGINLGVLGNKVVPDTSSLIGDPREHAETLQANHMEISRFSSGTDPNYVKVSGEIQEIYNQIEAATIRCPSSFNRDLQEESSEPITPSTLAAFIERLRFSGMHYRRETISPPSDNTAQWLFEDPIYKSWRSDDDASQRLLFIRGKPGAGKSVLMKEAVVNMKSVSNRYTICASFFINARGRPLEHSPVGLLRSLLCQLLPYIRRYMTKALCKGKRYSIIGILDYNSRETTTWTEQGLLTLLVFVLELLCENASVVIFIDALDELNDAARSRQAEFWRTCVSSFDCLRVCLSCRHFPHISITDCVELDLPYGGDVLLYIRNRFDARIPPKHDDWKRELTALIHPTSQGVFLWAVLIVDKVLEQYDAGASLKRLTELIQDTPKELEEFYASKLSSLEEKEKPIATRMFQWAIASARPLRLDEWHHIMAFIAYPSPQSLHEWRESSEFTVDDEQLERKIKTLSRGLLEISRKPPEAFNSNGAAETSSVDAGAGSLDQGQGSARVVQIIHESVRWFFLNSGGFSILGETSTDYLTGCHSNIAATCIDYIHIPELDDFVTARQGMEVTSSVWSSVSSQPHEVPQTAKGNNQAKSMFTNLQAMPTPNSVQFVESWMFGGFPTSSPPSVVETLGTLAPLDSIGIASQALEDYPALLVYSADELCYHIMEAVARNDPAPELMQRLSDEATWKRLADININVDSFAGYTNTKRLRSLFNHSSIFMRPSRKKSDFERVRRPKSIASSSSVYSIEGRRRPRSVASFTSACSHRGSQLKQTMRGVLTP